MTKTKKIVNLVLIISIIAALAGFSIACGNQETVQEETQMTEEQVEETATVETTAEETVAEPTTEDAGGCPAATSVSVESTNGAYADRMPISWDVIGSQAANLSHSTNNTAVFIYIANFETSENLKDVSLSDGQSVIQFTVTVKGEGDPVPVSLGTYNVKEWVDNYVSAGIRLTGGTTLTIASASVSSGDFVITSVTDTEICGKFSIDEKWTKMSGDFKVPVTD
jgi:hypothetical protein